MCKPRCKPSKLNIEKRIEFTTLLIHKVPKLSWLLPKVSDSELSEAAESKGLKILVSPVRFLVAPPSKSLSS